MSKLTQSTPFFEEVGAIPPAPRVFAGSLKVPPCILWIITAGYLAVHALPGIHALFLDHFLRFLFRGKRRRQPVTADVVILPRQFHSHIAAARPDTCLAHAAASHEGVKNGFLRSRHVQQVLNQRNGLAGQVDLLRGDHRIGIHTR